MTVRWLRRESSLGARRGDVVVGVIHDPHEPSGTSAAVTAVRRHTPADVPVVVIGLPDGLEPRGGTDDPLEVSALASGGRLGEAAATFGHLTAPADIVLMSSRCRPPADWLERLRSAARPDEAIATVTPLGDGGGAVHLSASRPAEADEVIRRVTLRTRPRLLIGGPHCVYVRRSALELAGGPPPDVNGLPELVATLCEICAACGMVNVVADDLFVRCDPAGLAPGALDGDGLAALDVSDERSGLQRALALSRAALSGLTVTIDARSLGSSAGGTQLYTLELSLALARSTDVSLRVVLGPDASPVARARLQETGAIEVITYEEAVAGVELSDVVHRPQQVFSAGDLNLLRLLGRRIIVSHQDLIAYHNPTYHSGPDSWEQYRRVTRIALATADRVVFFSEHSLRDARAEDLIATDRSDIIGVALGESPRPVPRRPDRVPTGQEFIVCLGPDYQHKNRCFALKLVAALRDEQNWRGILILAGGHVAHGSSRAQEQQLLADSERLRESVLDLGSVNDAEREWLFSHARAVLVPSVLEGFGLVPLEAARAGQACVFAPVSSLPEVASAELATLVPWDPSASAANVAPLLRDGSVRRDHITRLRSRAARWRWDELAGQLVGSYRAALRQPHRAAAVRAWQELERETYIAELGAAYEDLCRHVGNRIALASDEGFLTPEQQRGLLRVGSRPALARVALWPFALLGAIRAPGSRRGADR